MRGKGHQHGRTSIKMPHLSLKTRVRRKSTSSQKPFSKPYSNLWRRQGVNPNTMGVKPTSTWLHWHWRYRSTCSNGIRQLRSRPKNTGPYRNITVTPKQRHAMCSIKTNGKPSSLTTQTISSAMSTIITMMRYLKRTKLSRRPQKHYGRRSKRSTKQPISRVQRK